MPTFRKTPYPLSFVDPKAEESSYDLVYSGRALHWVQTPDTLRRERYDPDQVVQVQMAKEKIETHQEAALISSQHASDTTHRIHLVASFEHTDSVVTACLLTTYAQRGDLWVIQTLHENFSIDRYEEKHSGTYAWQVPHVLCETAQNFQLEVEKLTQWIENQSIETQRFFCCVQQSQQSGQSRTIQATQISMGGGVSLFLT